MTYWTPDEDWDSEPTSRPKEEPNCITCTDSGWTAPWGWWRKLAAWLNFDPDDPGTGRSWPCPDCNPTRIDSHLYHLRCRWLKATSKLRLRRTYTDEAPF